MAPKISTSQEDRHGTRKTLCVFVLSKITPNPYIKMSTVHTYIFTPYTFKQFICSMKNLVLFKMHFQSRDRKFIKNRENQSKNT